MEKEKKRIKTEYSQLLEDFEYLESLKKVDKKHGERI